jgi:hypothetical protein
MDENIKNFEVVPSVDGGIIKLRIIAKTETAKALLRLMWDGNKSGMGAPKILVFRAFAFDSSSGITAVVIENPKE